MYPVTAGGGQARSNQTSNLRQGMMVFGFFMDGQDQQIPVIMGVLGNNLSTPLSKESKNDRVTNENRDLLEQVVHSKPKGDTSKAEENAEDGPPNSGLLTSPNVDPVNLKNINQIIQIHLKTLQMKVQEILFMCKLLQM